MIKRKSNKALFPLSILSLVVLYIFLSLKTNIIHNALLSSKRNGAHFENIDTRNLYYSNNPSVDFIEARKWPNDTAYRRYIIEKRGENFLTKLKETVPLSKGAIGWNGFNYVDPNASKIRYSIEIPNLIGIERDGLIFGGNLYSSGHWLRSSKQNRDLKETRLWELMTGVIILNPEIVNKHLYDGIPSPIEGYDYTKQETPTTIADLRTFKIGQTKTISMFNHDTINFTVNREKDLDVNNETFHMFTTSDNQFSQIALLEKGDYIIVFVYGHDVETFDVFTEILKSYSNNLRDDASVGELAPVKDLDEIKSQKIFD